MVKHFNELVGVSDVTSLDTTRMNRDTFGCLCYLIEHIGGLTPTKNVEAREQVAMFLNILAHHTRNVVIRKSFKRSTFTISKYVHPVLLALHKLHPYFLVFHKAAGTNNRNERWNFLR